MYYFNTISPLAFELKLVHAGEAASSIFNNGHATRTDSFSDDKLIQEESKQNLFKIHNFFNLLLPSHN